MNQMGERGELGRRGAESPVRSDHSAPMEYSTFVRPKCSGCAALSNGAWLCFGVHTTRPWAFWEIQLMHKVGRDIKRTDRKSTITT